jgi:serine phosphatase RsbU (regulator of sigma subunit)/Flp pilus assembly protein TadD
VSKNQLQELEEELSSITDENKRMPILCRLMEMARKSDLTRCHAIAKELLTLAKKNDHQLYGAFAMKFLGVFADQEGNYPSAIRLFVEAKNRFTKENEIEEIIFCNNQLGKVYSNLGDYSKAVDLLDESLKLSKQTKDSTSEANTLNALSVIYQRMDNGEKAEEFADRSLLLAKELQNERMIAITEINLGNAYGLKNEWDRAIAVWTDSFKIFEKLGEERLTSSAFGNLGIAYQRLGNLEKAKEYIERCLEVKERLKDMYDVARSYHNLGTVYWKMGNIEEAKKLYNKALGTGEQSKAKSIHVMIYKDFAAMLKDIGDYKGALEIFEQYHSLEKTLFTEGMNVKTQTLEMRFEVERVEKENEIYRLKNIDLAEANEQITSQKEVIEQKNKDITDSILYAKKIQEAVLPSSSTMENLFGDFFVLYVPKDIVSGDFYWAAEKDGRKILAVADCTGHGVPGAIMSVMGSSFLSEIVGEKGVTVPSVALGLLRKKVVAAMQQGNDTSGTQDGMDIVFCCFDETGKTLLASCANNPIWIVRDEKLTELEADKFPVGIFPGQQKPFTLQEHKLKKGDFIYLFTDGYADQFGGPKEKKFGYKKMREVVLRIYKLPVKEQKEELEKMFVQWKLGFEQVDDVLVIGIRV